MLQEAIAKAIREWMQNLCERTEPWDFVNDFSDNAAEAVLGVLRASDDTRYVAITKQLEAIRDAHHGDNMGKRPDGWCVVCSFPMPCQTRRHTLEALAILAYDAVAPNAKDHA